MQFGIRKLLIVAVYVAVACAIFVVARNSYYSDRRQTESVLDQVSGISNITLRSHVEVVEEVSGSSFSVDNQPGSIVTLGKLVPDTGDGQFSITRIGKWTFHVFGRRHLGASRADTGESVESDYIGGNIELGPNSPYKHVIPFEVNTPQDLVDHYSDLVDLFETWPRESEPGTVTLDDGTTQYYFVIEADEKSRAK